MLQQYQALVDSQVLRPDAQQQACVQQLSQLCDRLSAYSTEVEHFQAESLRYLVMTMLPHELRFTPSYRKSATHK